jgi:ceramide glucosyltransferase
MQFAAARKTPEDRPARSEDPGVTVLKPVCGLEPELYENLCSFCDQTYGVFQVIFGVQDPTDPALEVIERVVQRFPTRDLLVAIGKPSSTRIAGANPKVANLTGMIGHAKYDLLVIADADMRVGTDYLRSIARDFASESVGAVTCLYAGAACTGFESTLAAMQINDQFAPSVLVAVALQRLRFCFGATMAVRHTVLDAIGGLGALASRLGDDYVLGELVSERGLAVRLSSYVVQNVVSEPGLGSLWRHEMRWARTVRAQRPLGYAFLFVTYPLPIALLFLALSPSLALGLSVALVATVLRVALHYAMRAALDVPGRPQPWLIPLRDALGLGVWIASFFGRSVRWRQRDFTLKAGGEIAR